MDISERIKNRRLELGISVDDIANALSVNRATVYRYESKDIEKMPITIVEPLAAVLRTTPAYLMGWEEASAEVTLLHPNRQRLQAAYANLSDDGQSKVADYAEDLDASGLYKRLQPMQLEDYSELYTIGSAAAGEGITNHPDIMNYRVIMATQVPPHDFAVDVRGTSMWPTIYDGDVVFASKKFDQIDNQIYVVNIDGETVVKRVIFENHRLILVSDNPDWPDRVITDEENLEVRIEGKVVGWETPA